VQLLWLRTSSSRGEHQDPQKVNERFLDGEMEEIIGMGSGNVKEMLDLVEIGISGG
jgi:hypothetical protein